MAGVEPYAPCPCGSGQKFKWCCQKVESFADRAQRLVETGQVEAAIKILDEGLRKEPGNPLLLMRKGIIQIRHGDAEGAKATLRQILAKNAKHFGALVLLTRCVLETEGPVNGAGMFQQVLAAVEPEQKANLAPLGRVVSYLLGEFGRFSAALKHLQLVEELGDEDGSIAGARANLLASPTVSPWFKDEYVLAEAPDHFSDEAFQRFELAMDWAETGLWSPAAATFDQLSWDDAGGEADYNLGLCRLWLGDESGAVGPLRRRSKRLGDSILAVDLEALCQELDPIHPDDRVEFVQLQWPLRDRSALIANLQAAPDVHHAGRSKIEPDNPDSPESDEFALLDKPEVTAADVAAAAGKLTVDRMPQVLGRLHVGQEVVALEAFDDGRIDGLGDRFTALAGKSIAPAHPRTKVLGEESRSALAVAWQWLTPEDLDPAEEERLNLENRARLINEVWPNTPMPYLGFRTPLKAAQDGDAKVPLRAAVCTHEINTELARVGLDFAALRARLHLPPEPAIDLKTLHVDELALARFHAIPVEQLDDERLVAFYRRARETSLIDPLRLAAVELANRPAIFEQGKLDHVIVFSDLASLTLNRGAAGSGTIDEALAWIARGRQHDSPAARGFNAPRWDLIEVRLKARVLPPETWVPELAVVLERYAQQQAANQLILMNLVEMGLVRVGPNPDRPQEMLLDSRPLQAVMAEFGPRITTSSGRLGVSATRPDLWTPGSPAAGTTGGVWTPGSGSSSGSTSAEPGGDKPKLIIPGR